MKIYKTTHKDSEALASQINELVLTDGAFHIRTKEMFRVDGDYIEFYEALYMLLGFIYDNDHIVAQINANSSVNMGDDLQTGVFISFSTQEMLAEEACYQQLYKFFGGSKFTDVKTLQSKETQEFLSWAVDKGFLIAKQSLLKSIQNFLLKYIVNPLKIFWKRLVAIIVTLIIGTIYQKFSEIEAAINTVLNWLK